MLPYFLYAYQTPLHLAVITGQKNLIGLLIKAGSDVNAVDRNGQTPLHLVCQRNDVDCARVIFDSFPVQNKITIDAKNFEGKLIDNSIAWYALLLK